jgi:hypothetical protein
MTCLAQCQDNCDGRQFPLPYEEGCDPPSYTKICESLLGTDFITISFTNGVPTTTISYAWFDENCEFVLDSDGAPILTPI